MSTPGPAKGDPRKPEPNAPRVDPSDATRLISAASETDAGETQVIDIRPTLPGPRGTEPATENLSTTTAIPSQSPPADSPVLLRFGPGVPAQRPARPTDESHASARRSSRGWGALNLVLTAALALVVAWLLRPSPPVEVRRVTVQAPAVVGCQGTADVVGTLQTNGRSGSVKYRWIRNDGTVSGTLTAKPVSGDTSVGVHMRWSFTGAGTYAATATLEVLDPIAPGSSTSFTYRC